MTKLRLGFLGVGWIGRHRMQAALATGLVDAVAICDPSADCRQEALKLAPDATPVADLDEMLDLAPDAIVIATPSALHADQAIRCLDVGVAVFCQKPVGRSEDEVRRVIDTACRANRLFSADFSYRHTEGMRKIKRLIDASALGNIFAIDLTFHNAYGPGKAWFYDRALSGGGCVMDLGSHLVDLALWSLDCGGSPDIVSADLFSGGRPLADGSGEVEDYAAARLLTARQQTIGLACSWRLHAGQEARIEAAFYGTEGGAALRNIGGSFYDFEAEVYNGTSRERLCAPPDQWGGRAISAWIETAAQSLDFRADVRRYIDVARTLDQIYAFGDRQLSRPLEPSERTAMSILPSHRDAS